MFSSALRFTTFGTSAVAPSSSSSSAFCSAIALDAPSPILGLVNPDPDPEDPRAGLLNPVLGNLRFGAGNMPNNAELASVSTLTTCREHAPPSSGELALRRHSSLLRIRIG